MRVFISADIEGTTFTTLWDETELGHNLYAAAAKQMTAEVKAACEGAIAAGADYILVNDAHDHAVNLDVNELPECVEVIRGWSGSPMGMVDGVDNTFDAAMFIGYHSAAGRNGNPLSHTFTTKTTSVKLNGMVCSEFLLYSWACAMMGVPTVLLAGDKMLTEDSQGLHPKLKTVAVKDGFGAMIRCLHPKVACDKIRTAAEEGLKQDLSDAVAKVPEHFVFELSYKEHKTAVRMSSYPGCVLVDDRTVRFESDDFMEVLRRKGWRVQKANNDVLSGIRLTSDCLKTGKIVICEGCGDCLREMEEYVWDLSGGSKDRVRKEHDHAMDDMRYFVSTVLGEKQLGFTACVVERKK